MVEGYQCLIRTIYRAKCDRQGRGPRRAGAPPPKDAIEAS
jgi:hypothetical protein